MSKDFNAIFIGQLHFLKSHEISFMILPCLMNTKKSIQKTAGLTSFIFSMNLYEMAV